MCRKLNENCNRMQRISNTNKNLTSNNESAYKMLHNLHGEINIFSSTCRWWAEALDQIWMCF